MLFVLVGKKSFVAGGQLLGLVISFSLGVGILCYVEPANLGVSSGISNSRAELLMTGRVISLQGRSRVGEMRIAFEAQGGVGPPGYYLVSLADLPWLLGSEIAEGSCISIRGRLARESFTAGYQNPFNYLSYLRRRGYVTSMKAYIVELCPTLGCINSQKGFSQDKLLSSIVQNFGSSDGLAILVASVLGRADLVGQTVLDVFRRTGTIHLLVVSGFHIGTLYGVFERFFLCLLSFSMTLRVRNLVVPVASAVSFLGTLWYAWLVGFSPPSVRALFALLLYIIARVKVRRLSAPRALLFTLVIVNVFWPGSLFEAGVQFTFAALIGLVLGNRLWMALPASWKPANSVLSSLILNMVVCTSCWLCTAPLTYVWFGQINLISPLINALVAVPFTLVTVVGGGVSLLWWYLDLPFGELLVRATAWVTEQIYRFLELFW